ncbi:MAG: lysylphosphatidylglycerol synthase transmembrane domain-containing protein [bacterium]
MKLLHVKKFSFFVLRFSISFLLIYFLLRKIDFHKLSSKISDINYSFLFLAFICQLSVIFIATYRWQTLLSGRDIKIEFKKLLNFNFIGLFFNSFLPGASSGDFVKMYKVVNHCEDKIYAGISVLAERIIGIYSISVLVLAACIFSFKMLPRELIFAILSMIFVIYYALFLFISLKSWITGLMDKSQGSEKALDKIKQYIIIFYEAMHFFITHRKVLLKVLFYSLLMQILSIISCYFVARAAGLDLSVFYFFIFVPIVFLATVIPISLSGIGVREGIFVYLFNKVNVPSEEAIFISLLYFSVGMMFSLAGGVVHFISNIKKAD